MARRARREPGFALLIVLWWTVLLALLAAQLATAGRLEAQRAGNLRGAAQAEAAADGALHEAAFHLLDGSGAGWAADGASHEVAVVGGVAHVEVRSEAAKVALNQAPAGLVAALLARLGAGQHEAAALADAILDWRTTTIQARPLGAKAPEYRAAGLGYAPPDSSFETLDELGLVRGMTPGLLARVAPFVTVHWAGDVDRALAAPPVLLATADAGGGSAEDDATAPVVTVSVSVELANGARLARRTVLRLAANAMKRPFQVLDQD